MYHSIDQIKTGIRIGLARHYRYCPSQRAIRRGHANYDTFFIDQNRSVHPGHHALVEFVLEIFLVLIAAMIAQTTNPLHEGIV
eukprot:CAMPEP_0116041788 /NCGR_PEP_ID=MMETSP0321-20121206/25275_1 /TAXON_ID=163516 /ORGANISM="Leptocylindrus danicus var. danicus, Strain B650" /LENGTH=82 /DNA_ID=CAMNT_0003522085 /DNA_START=330 /DNA_END=578 /DNA_ORIENTATION=-